MECPRCGSPMEEHTFDAHLGRAVAIDICFPCQVFWFDARESISLTPGATLALFRLMGDRLAKASVTHADTAKCPRCRTRLQHAVRADGAGGVEPDIAEAALSVLRHRIALPYRP